MQKSRFTDERITDALRRADAGESVTTICREMGISRNAFYIWRRTYKWTGIMRRRLRQLEEENHKLKWLLADLSPNKDILQEELSKAVLTGNGDSAIHIFGDRTVRLQQTEREPALV